MDCISLANEYTFPWSAYPNTNGKSHRYNNFGWRYTGNQIQKITLEEINFNDVKLELITPIYLAIQRDSNFFIIDYPEGGIHIAEPTKDEAIKAFHEDFVFLWHQYAEADDTEFTKDAVVLKNWLLKKAKVI